MTETVRAVVACIGVDVGLRNVGNVDEKADALAGMGSSP